MPLAGYGAEPKKEPKKEKNATLNSYSFTKRSTAISEGTNNRRGV